MTSPAPLWIFSVVALAGCSAETSSSSSAPVDSPTVIHQYQPDATSNVLVQTDGGALGMAADDATTALAAPTPTDLCRVPAPPAWGCNPDILNPPAKCSGSDEAGALADSSTVACHVMPSDTDGGIQPTCTVAGPHQEGEPCASPNDCAATLECVGDGVCRHYCCSGTVSCSDQEFCDVEAIVGSGGTRVPVCAPIQACSLFAQLGDAGTCDVSQTCSVVREGTGATGCVNVGRVLAGGACDLEPCAGGLACLGNWGTRRCFTLCHTGAPIECSTGQTCVSGLPMFADPKIGVCQ